MLLLSLFTFVSGLLTIFAPCIWPLLPIILSASTKEGKKRPLGIALGISVSFAIFTLSISYLLNVFSFDVENLRIIAVIVVGLMGITFIVPRLTQILEGYISKLSGKINIILSDDEGFKSSFVLGLSLGLVWTPCAGPILASIATLAATRAVTAQVVLLTFVYALGAGIPLFLFSFYGQRLFSKTRFLSKNLELIQQIFGLLMVLTAISIYFGYDKTLQSDLLDRFPRYAEFLNNFESNEVVLDELKVL